MTHFCTPEVKKFMMDKADRLRDRIFNAMKQAWKTAAMTAVATVALGVAGGCAQDAGVPRNLKYIYNQNPMFDPAYTLARDAMAGLYIGSEYQTGGGVNPSIDIAQTDLNGDQMDEIIATPVEATDEEETATLCNADKTCPFYVLEVRNNAVHKLAVINAFTVDRGDDIKNGYWTLTVYRQAPDGTPLPSTYVYDKQKDGYVPAASPAPAKAPAAKAP